MYDWPPNRTGKAGGVLVTVVAVLFLGGLLSWYAVRRNTSSNANAQDANENSASDENRLQPPADAETPIPSVPANQANDAYQLPSTDKGKQVASELTTNVAASAQAWPTEAFSEQATAKLKQLAKHLTYPATIDEICGEGFQSDDLRPDELTTTTSGTTTVRRWEQGQAQANGQAQKSGSQLSVGLSDLFADIKQPRAAFKIVRVSRSQDGYFTAVYAEGGGATSSAQRQWTGIWNCTWNDNAQLTSISLQDYEEVETGQPGPWLVDSTSSVLANDDVFRTQLAYGMDYWVNRIEHRFYTNRLGHHGLAIGDVNNDGLEDLYVCQPGGLPNRLYLHKTDGTSQESAATAGLDILDDTTAALFVDLDNDSDQDLAILTVSGGFVFENQGNGQFQRKVILPECQNAFSITAADYNQDGRLDLYVGRYWPDETVRGAIPLPVPYFDALNGGRNILFRNDDGWSFEDVTEEAGLDVDNTRYTMAAAWEDYDNDGDQDLYVANDFGRNCLYRNDDGKFANVAPALGVEDTAAGMSVSWADYDHDGNQDVYIGNMFSSAGGRITYQPQYSERFAPTAQEKLQRLARGNSLFRNRNDRFEDVSAASHVTMGRWAWGSVFVDLDNDSWEDLIIANGHVTTDDTGDL